LITHTIKFEAPNSENFRRLRANVGWGEIDIELATKSLANSLFNVTVYQHSHLIAMGRVVGDGAMYFYVQDVMVDVDYQNIGLGTVVMEHIENYLAETAMQGATIGLMAAKGKERFYQRYAYVSRPTNSLGNGMCKFI